jgi:hypothetical protein
MHEFNVHKVPPVTLENANRRHCYPGTLYLASVDAPLQGGYVRMEGRAVCWRFPRGNTALALALPVHCKDLRRFRACTVY